jgi:cellulose synthase/poly-beta-1,6-N-acetylglucosamine synthase-like glycosyltransferase
VYIYSSIALVIGVAYFLLMLLYRFGGGSAKDFGVDEHSPKHQFSIIIPARNESANIVQCLRSILANEYSTAHYEIIVIDDFSEDDTFQLASSLLSAPHKVLRLSDYLSPQERINAFKKKALSIAIGEAKGKYIITTDADCIVPETWLSTINTAINKEPYVKCWAAPVNFIPANEKADLCYYFQSVDFMTMQGITAASNKLGLGNMSNGANFIFEKSAYEEVGAYAGIDHKASGDDMMLMQKINKKFPKSIGVLFDQNAMVNTVAQPDWKSFLNQRIRWASKADSYPQLKMTLVLLLVYLANLNLVIVAIASFWHHQIAIIGLLIFISKVIAELIFVIPLSKFFGKRKELLFLIVLQPLHIIYVVSAGFLGKFGKYTWKDRVVK